ncbi:secretin N-terminal domain-containing protein [Halarsenatibacter silvermanii]|uniref:Type II secretory pathway component GspD/PulD (Secretin) n=1 Tax=Halarsenatibacter silvermanii TaxID=321763 RepID=A0A1G9LCC2_9FIRM|nr:secretin N-terminal domain-containing protein [Halarsenatibacter silvermanii]SDL59590.1 Type II secretory pathway component GspD/PulD (secretin) [Halarsenatibacter silvermanii]
MRHFIRESRLNKILTGLLIAAFILTTVMPAAASPGNIDLEYRSTEIQDVIRSLAFVAGENIVVDDSVQGEVTVQLTGMTFERALDHLLRIKNLEKHREDDVLIVATSERIDELYRELERGLVSLDYLGADKAAEIIRELQPGIDVQVLTGQNRLILRGFAHQMKETADLLADIDQPEEREQEVVEVHRQSPENVAEELRELFPGLTVRPRPGTGDVIIHGRPDTVLQAVNLVEFLDVPDRDIEEIYRPKRVKADQLYSHITGLYPEEALEINMRENVIFLHGSPAVVNGALEMLEKLDEAEFIESSLAFQADYIDVEDLVEIFAELDPDLRVSSSQGGRRIVLRGEENSVQLAEELINSLDVPRRQVMLEVRIEEVSHTLLKERGIDPDEVGNFTTFGVDYDDDYLPRRFDMEIPADFYKLLDETDSSQTLAHPRLMTLDGEEASLVIADLIPYEVIEYDGDREISSIDFEEKEVGITMEFVPTITRDDTITLDIRPEVSTLIQEGPELTPPQVRSREFHNIVNLRDGQTFAVGGLIHEEIQELSRKFPVLGDLPVLGTIFSYERERDVKTEIIIFITPRIIDLDEGLPDHLSELGAPKLRDYDERGYRIEEDSMFREEIEERKSEEALEEIIPAEEIKADEEIKEEPKAERDEKRKPLSERIDRVLEEQLEKYRTPDEDDEADMKDEEKEDQDEIVDEIMDAKTEEEMDLDEEEMEIITENLMDEDRDRKELKEDDITRERLQKIIFRSRLNRRTDWPEEVEYTFLSDEFIRQNDLQEMFGMESDLEYTRESQRGDLLYTVTLPGEMVYRLGDNETLGELADRSGISAETILAASGMTADEVSGGDLVVIPWPKLK